MPRIADEDDLGGGLSPAEAMELWLGPNPSLSSRFRTPEEARAMWNRHRDELMRRHGSNGRRPVAWWCFEAPFPYPGHDVECSTLWRAGALGEDKRLRIEARWRQEFDRAQEPGFVEYEDSQMVEGVRARRLHYEWADIPHELAEQWTAERRRQRRRAGKGSPIPTG
jgi:hypothetical protein